MTIHWPNLYLLNSMIKNCSSTKSKETKDEMVEKSIWNFSKKSRTRKRLKNNSNNNIIFEAVHIEVLQIRHQVAIHRCTIICCWRYITTNDFGGVANNSKGVFPYEAINTENYNEVLSQAEPFEYEAFYSYLNQKNPLTPDDYKLYLEDTKNYKTRWDYLLAYNDND